jgi:hypothetical protein
VVGVSGPETGIDADDEHPETGIDDGDETDTGTDHADTERPVEYLKWAGVVVLAVTAMVALFGFYTGVSRAITVWISSGYRPLVSAAFNFSLLLVAVGGIGVLLRRGD